MFVKDIPEYVRMNRLRELFSGKGEITDVKLMHNIRYIPSYPTFNLIVLCLLIISLFKFRFGLFALIEFLTDHEAQEVVQCFNRSYIDTSIITCEVGRSVCLFVFLLSCSQLVPLDFDYGVTNNDYAQEFTVLVIKKKKVFDPCRLFIFLCAIFNHVCILYMYKKEWMLSTIIITNVAYNFYYVVIFVPVRWNWKSFSAPLVLSYKFVLFFFKAPRDLPARLLFVLIVHNLQTGN